MKIILTICCLVAAIVGVNGNEVRIRKYVNNTSVLLKENGFVREINGFYVMSFQQELSDAVDAMKKMQNYSAQLVLLPFCSKYENCKVILNDLANEISEKANLLQMKLRNMIEINVKRVKRSSFDFFSLFNTIDLFVGSHKVDDRIDHLEQKFQRNSINLREYFESFNHLFRMVQDHEEMLKLNYVLYIIKNKVELVSNYLNGLLMIAQHKKLSPDVIGEYFLLTELQKAPKYVTDVVKNSEDIYELAEAYFSYDKGLIVNVKLPIVSEIKWQLNILKPIPFYEHANTSFSLLQTSANNVMIRDNIYVWIENIDECFYFRDEYFCFDDNFKSETIMRDSCELKALRKKKLSGCLFHKNILLPNTFFKISDHMLFLNAVDKDLLIDFQCNDEKNIAKNIDTGIYLIDMTNNCVLTLGNQTIKSLTLHLKSQAYFPIRFENFETYNIQSNSSQIVDDGLIDTIMNNVDEEIKDDVELEEMRNNRLQLKNIADFELDKVYDWISNISLDGLSEFSDGLSEFYDELSEFCDGISDGISDYLHEIREWCFGILDWIQKVLTYAWEIVLCIFVFLAFFLIMILIIKAIKIFS